MKENQHYPGVSTFRRDEQNNIYLCTQAYFGPGDDYCVPWHLFDLLPSGSINVQTKMKLNNQSSYQLTNNIAIGVRDYDNAIAFYQEVLGMKVEQTFENETKFTISGTNFFIESTGERIVHFEFAVEDIETTKYLLLEKGCQITKEYSPKSVMVEDPFGMNFHLFESIK
ncbi:putative enzyme related to lactoylglutathione lyase [Evansella vedderi]|uniref:Enzyme related to lactoylglutathione lyase n=1 Tax=Evansella vedderi TaxID=38282 RepID=A0ABU0A3A4_9BACI|nr:VOC family protein [Evansella vedderi]MDQ0257735.1 putative enzyme related to lactoylglutathione lyase [Evansella vedderi]